jgi:ribonuclease Z
MKKRYIFIAIVLVVAGVLGLQKHRLVSAVFEKGLEWRIQNNWVAELDDGLHLALCGAGGPMPAPNASGPCVVIIAGQRMFVVDAGTDGLRNIGRMGMQIGDIEAIFLTHFHSDHIDGLGEMATIRWVSKANTAALPVYGPAGIDGIVDGFNTVYALDKIYRHEHHGDTVAPLSGAGMIAKPFSAPADGQLAVLVDDGDLKIAALSVQHAPISPAVGYRISYKGRSLLISGDTIASENVKKFSEGIDLLVHEALAPNLVKKMHDAGKKVGNKVLEKVSHDILDYHTYPIEAAEIARDAKVGHLLYYHIVPPLVMPGQKTLFLDGADEVFPNYTIGADGVVFSLPVGSSKIIKMRDGL